MNYPTGVSLQDLADAVGSPSTNMATDHKPRRSPPLHIPRTETPACDNYLDRLSLNTLDIIADKINSGNLDGYIMLKRKLYAADKDDLPKIFSYLSEKGVIIDSNNKQANQAMMQALFDGNADVLESWLKAGANVNARVTGGKYKGSTALSVAICKNYTDIALKLIQAGADVNIPDNENRSTLLRAIWRKNNEVSIALINADVDLEHKTRVGSGSLLMDAVYNNMTDVALSLIDAGADVETHTDNGTALRIACQTGNLEIVTALLNANADLDKTNFGGLTALHTAIVHGHIEIAEMLLLAGANVFIEDHNGDTAFVTAVNSAHADFTDLAIKMMVRGSSPFEGGRTGNPDAIDISARSGNRRLIISILEAVKDEDAFLSAAFKAIDEVLGKGKLDTARLIERMVQIIGEDNMGEKIAMWKNLDAQDRQTSHETKNAISRHHGKSVVRRRKRATSKACAL